MRGNEMGAYSYDDPIEIPGLARRRRWLIAVALVVLLAAAALFAVRRSRTNLASLLPMAAPTGAPATRAAPGPDIPLPRESTPDTSHPAPVTDVGADHAAFGARAVAPTASSPTTAAVSPSATAPTHKANSRAAAVAAAPRASESVPARAAKPEPAAHVARRPSGSIVRDTPF